jgi:ligand-binding sensor domain-containing protein
MAEGDDGTLWFVSDYGLVMTYDSGTWAAVADLDEETFDIAVQSDAVWVGSSSGLVRHQQGRTRRYTTADGLTSNTILELVFDPANPDLLWLGTADGVNRVDTADGSVETWARESAGALGPFVDALYFDAAGVLLAGVGDHAEESTGTAGLLRFDGTAWQVAGKTGDPFTADDRTVWAITDDGQGGLWVGTDLYLYHWDGTDWRQYTQTDGAPDDGIVGLAVAGDVLWVATQYDGLYRLDAIGWYRLGYEGTGTLYLEGLYHTTDGALWIWGDSGVTRLVGDPLAFDP